MEPISFLFLTMRILFGQYIFLSSLKIANLMFSEQLVLFVEYHISSYIEKLDSCTYQREDNTIHYV